MARTAALSSRLVDRSLDAMRSIIVGGCALALIAAGRTFPF